MTKQAPQAPAPVVKIEPYEGWTPNTKYGLQRADDTDAGRLVRLEEVATWLAQKWPRDRVINELFGPLIDGDGVEAGGLYVLRASGAPVPLIKGGAPNPAADGFWQYLPFVDSRTLPEYVARDLAGAWDEAWPGLSDPDTDKEWQAQRAIKANRDRNRLAKLFPDEDPMALVPRTAFDSEGLALKMARLAKLAIPLVQAHALWGYGRVVAPAAEVVSLVVVPKAVPTFPLADFDALVAYRLANKGKPWAPGNQIALAVAAVEQQKTSGLEQSAAYQAVAEKWGSDRQTLEKALTRIRKKKTAHSFPSAGQLAAGIGK